MARAGDRESVRAWLTCAGQALSRGALQIGRALTWPAALFASVAVLLFVGPIVFDRSASLLAPVPNVVAAFGQASQPVGGENTAPVADPGRDQTVAVGATVILDASGSSDVDGDLLDFFWSLIKAPEISGKANEVRS